MNDDDLRERLGRLDPVPETVAMEAPTSKAARERLEKIMTTTPISPARSSDPASPDHERRTGHRRTRRAWVLGVAAVAVVALGVGIAATRGGDGATDQAGPPLELSLGAGDAMASCLPLDAGILAQMPTAFGATVTAIDGEEVTMAVDTWFAGTDTADTVVLHADSGLEALIGGVDFSVGERYLITATNGSVNYCGYSGSASDAGLAGAFSTAFGA